MSRRCGCGFFVSGTTMKMPTRPAITIGTLMRKTAPQSLPVSQFVQDGCSRSRPPSTGPSAMAAPTEPAQAPIALPRSCGGKTTVMIASVTGMTAAPPIPMSPRKRMSISGDEANAQAADATPKMMRPMTRMRLRPYVSPRTPQVNSSAANTRM